MGFGFEAQKHVAHNLTSPKNESLKMEKELTDRAEAIQRQILQMRDSL